MRKTNAHSTAVSTSSCSTICTPTSADAQSRGSQTIRPGISRREQPRRRRSHERPPGCRAGAHRQPAVCCSRPSIGFMDASFRQRAWSSLRPSSRRRQTRSWQTTRSRSGRRRAPSGRATIRDPLDPERGTNARRALEAIRERVRLDVRRAGPPQGAAVLQRRHRLRRLRAVQRASPRRLLVRDTQDAISAAQRANVNVYAVDPRGLNQFGGARGINARSDYPQLDTAISGGPCASCCSRRRA